MNDPRTTHFGFAQVPEDEKDPDLIRGFGLANAPIRPRLTGAYASDTADVLFAAPNVLRGGRCPFSAERERDVTGEMRLRSRRQVRAGRTMPGRAWLLYACAAAPAA